MIMKFETIFLSEIIDSSVAESTTSAKKTYTVERGGPRHSSGKIGELLSA
jgi:hypothetical protein